MKPHCRTCDQILGELEKIDDELDGFGILLVRVIDPPLAKRYAIKTFPALVYFRNGNPLTYDGKKMVPRFLLPTLDVVYLMYAISCITGDLKDELAVFEWLISDDNRELDDAIEEVGDKMLLKLIERSPFIAVYFCE